MPQVQQPLAHAQDCGSASRRPIQAPQQFLARRLGDGAKPRQVGCRRFRGVRLGSFEHLLGIGRELSEQPGEKSRLVLYVELAVKIEGGLRQRYASRLAALGQ